MSLGSALFSIFQVGIIGRSGKPEERNAQEPHNMRVTQDNLRP